MDNNGFGVLEAGKRAATEKSQVSFFHFPLALSRASQSSQMTDCRLTSMEYFFH